MRKRRDPLLVAALVALLAAIGAGVLAILETRGDLLRWKEARRPPPPPLAVELVMGGRGPFLTITEAPPRRIEASPALLAEGQRLLPKDAPAIAPDLADGVRMLARLEPPGPPDPEARLMTFDAVEPNLVRGRVIFRDGCLRLAGAGEPLVVVPAGARLARDAEGHVLLVVVQNAKTNPRVGEPALWSEAAVRQLPIATAERMRRLCGPGRIALLGLAQSESAVRTQSDVVAARNFDERYGLGFPESLRRVVRCRERFGVPMGAGNLCGSTPPPPVADPASCPAGTALSGGLCRTPEGKVRPIPDL